MKRVLAVLLAAAMLCVMLAGCGGSGSADPGVAEQVTQPQQSAQTPGNTIAPADQFAGGTGTAEDPYQIQDAAQLVLFAQLLNGDTYSAYGSAYYELTSDIALNDVSEGHDWANNPPAYVWEPIGTTVNNMFAGQLEGNGHVISGMYIHAGVGEGQTEYYGLFGRLAGSVKNLAIENAYIYVEGSSRVAGSVAGEVLGEGAVENCTSDAQIVIGGGLNAGGIVGKGGTILDCTFTGSLSQFDDSWCHLGGIVGYEGKVTGCTNLGTVSGLGYSGGIAGWGAIIENSVNRGAVSGDTAGGIAGNMYKTGMGVELEETNYGIWSCSNEGAVAGVTVAGGILGKLGNDEVDLAMDIADCENSGQVSCDAVCAGIIGSVSVERASEMAVENCVNHADLTGKETVGGIIGELKGAILHQEGEFTVSGCVNSGSITSEGLYSSGILTYVVLMGEKTDLQLNILDCTNSGAITSQDYAGGITGVFTTPAAGNLDISSDSVITLEGCTNSGAVTVLTSNSYVGGISGNLGIAGIKTVVSDCRNSGGVNLLFTLTDEEIKSTVEAGAVMTVSQMAGGIVGRIGDGLFLTTDNDGGDASTVNASNPWITLENCHNSGILEVSDYSAYTAADGQQIWKNYVGGIVGNACGEKAYSFAVVDCTYSGTDRGLGNAEFPDVGTN